MGRKHNGEAVKERSQRNLWIFLKGFHPFGSSDDRNCAFGNYFIDVSIMCELCLIEFLNSSSSLGERQKNYFIQKVYKIIHTIYQNEWLIERRPLDSNGRNAITSSASTHSIQFG